MKLRDVCNTLPPHQLSRQVAAVIVVVVGEDGNLDALRWQVDKAEASAILSQCSEHLSLSGGGPERGGLEH